MDEQRENDRASENSEAEGEKLPVDKGAEARASENSEPDEQEANSGSPNEQVGVLENGRGQPQPTFPDGTWRHWTDGGLY